jgi:hypothetical protein
MNVDILGLDSFQEKELFFQAALLYIQVHRNKQNDRKLRGMYTALYILTAAIKGNADLEVYSV